MKASSYIFNCLAVLSLSLITVGASGQQKHNRRTAASREYYKIYPGTRPDSHLQDKSDADRTLWNELKPLFYKVQDMNVLKCLYYKLRKIDPYKNDHVRVRRELLTTMGGTPFTVQTADNKKIAGIQVVRKNAPLTLVFVTGFFDFLTPTKEWVGPFTKIFNTCNIVMFDWRGFGQSKENLKKKNTKVPLAASEDIKAVLKHCRTEKSLSQVPLVMYGYCLGAALALKTVIEMQESASEKHLIPDALNLSCMPTHVEKMKKTVKFASPNTSFRISMSIPFVRNHFFNRAIDKSIRAIKPLDLLSRLTIPCNLDYSFADKMVPITMGIENVHALRSRDTKYVSNFIIADVARHVRLHQYPSQYCDAQFAFFKKAGLISSSHAPK